MSFQLSASKRLLLLLVALATGAACYFHAENRAAADGQDIQARLLSQAVELAHTINPERANALSFTPSDADLPEYRRLCEQMILFQHASEIKGIWSLALRDGKLRFGPESYVPGDPLASPPGDLYLEPSAQHFAIFRDGKPFVIGPMRDEFGEFITSAAPVRDTQSGEVIMAVCMDLPAADWHARMRRIRLMAVLCVLPLGLILLVGIWLSGSPRPHTPSVTVAVFALTVTLFVATERGRHARQSRHEAFSLLASHHAQRLQTHINHINDRVLKAIGDLFQHSDRVTRSEFEAMASKYLSYSGIYGIVWIERVEAADIGAWLAHMRQEGYPDLALWQPGPAGTRLPADLRREVFYPVRYSMQSAGGGRIAGLDEGAIPQRLEALERTFRDGLPTATPPHAFVNTTNAFETGIIAFNPVYKEHAGGRRLLGFVLAAFKPEGLIRAALGATPNTAHANHMAIHELTENASPLLIAACCATNAAASHLYGGNAFHHISPAFAFGKAYALSVTPDDAIKAATPFGTPFWTALATGCVISALLTLLTLLLTRQHVRLETKVRQRTQALRESEANYRESEARERQLNQMLGGLRTLNQLIVRSQDQQTLIETACHNLTATLGYETAWIALFDDDDNLTASAIAGADSCFEVLKRHLVLKRFPACMNAVLRGDAFFSNRNPSETCAGVCPMAESHHGHAGMTVRLDYEGHRYGILVVSVPTGQIDAHTTAELFKELAADLGFALRQLATKQELVESEQRFRALLDNAPEAIYVQIDGIFDYLNSKAVELFNAPSADALLGTPTLVHFLPDDHKIIISRRALLAANHTVPPVEHTLVRPDGICVSVEITAVAIHFKQRDGVLVFMRDLTESKKNETEKRQLEEQLHQSQKLESLGQLAGGVAHDYNNMLQVILGHAELLLQDTPSGSDAAHDLSDILNAARRSADLTRQLLAFARKQTVNPRALDINNAIGDLLRMLRPLLGAGIDLIWHPGLDLPHVMMDPMQINQILTNLTVNARDAMNSKGTLTIETAVKNLPANYPFTESDTGPGDYLVISASDTGCGMDKETLTRMWEPFYTTKPAGKGTGLGLSTVYGIARQCEGFVQAYSEPGKGTTFRIYLPCCDLPSDVASDERSPLRRHGHETILVVDDEPALLAFNQKLLEKMGYTVLIASGPRQALHIAAAYTGQIDLLLTDVVMPEMNGRELYEQLSALRPNMKTLFMSGYTANAIAHHEILDKGIQFVQKPFTSAEMEQALFAVFIAPAAPAPANG